LAILLAIRDCKIDALTEIKPRLPPGLFEVLQKALARNPSQRYGNAVEFAQALAPFEADKRLASREIAERVRWVKAAASTEKVPAQRDNAAMRVVRARSSMPARTVEPEPEDAAVEVGGESLLDDDDLYDTGAQDGKTSEYEMIPSRVLKLDGTQLGPWTFARLMEALATGQIERGDRIDFVGRGFLAAEDIDEFQRFFPAPSSATTNQVKGPGAPDFHDQIGPRTMLETLMHVLSQSETGVLFVERAEEGESGVGSPHSRGGKKELYFVQGRLNHVASSNASELLGEYLVRRGKLEREELDLALAVLPRYGGRMGDTLISMGLVGPVDIFRAIRDQGRDRVADLFLWRGGQLSFYRGHTAPHVEFPLDLELPALMLAGLETAKPGDAILRQYRPNLDRMLGPALPQDDLFSFDNVTWPPVVTGVVALVRKPLSLREVLQKAATEATLGAGDVLRAVEILLAAGLLIWK
jgi:serine/threonine-protein kinase